MEVSTREHDGVPDVGVARGARHALRLAASFGPSFLPLLPAAFALLCLPWLDSLQAMSESEMLLLRSDAVMRSALAQWSSGLGGTPGLLALGGLLSALWLILLRHWGAWNPTVVLRAVLARHGSPRASVLLSLACAALAIASIRTGATPLARWVDIASGLRPTGQAGLAAVALSQGLALLLLGACTGAVIASLETARMPRARLGTLGILLALGVMGGVTQSVSATWLARRLDAQRSVADILGVTSAAPPPVDVVLLARDRLWRFQVRAGLDDVAFDRALALRAEQWIVARSGWSLVAPRLESYIVGERLLALDPAGAREASLRAILTCGAYGSVAPLLVSLGAAHADERALEVLAKVADAPELVRGPLALHLIARAAGVQGDRSRAELALAQLRGVDGERRLVSVRSVPPIILADMTDGQVGGRLLLDGRPLDGRVGLIATQDLFEMPKPGHALPITWLLRLGGATDIGPDGRFAFDTVRPGEHALVLLDTGKLAGLTAPPLARIVVTSAARVIDLGDISLSTAH